MVQSVSDFIPDEIWPDIRWIRYSDIEGCMPDTAGPMAGMELEVVGPCSPDVPTFTTEFYDVIADRHAGDFEAFGYDHGHRG